MMHQVMATVYQQWPRTSLGFSVLTTTTFSTFTTFSLGHTQTKSCRGGWGVERVRFRCLGGWQLQQ